MAAAETGSVLLQAIPDDPSAAMGAFLRHHRYGALEAVERPGFVAAHHLERLVVFIAAQVAFRHGRLLPGKSGRDLALGRAPRPEPLFLPPPLSLLTVAQARRSASSLQIGRAHV